MLIYAAEGDLLAAFSPGENQMVSAVEQMAANTSWSALGKAKDLRNRILLHWVALVYRLGTLFQYH